MIYEVVTPAAAEPLSLTEVKLHLRVTNSVEDALITAKYTAARQRIEALTGPLVSTAMRDLFPCFLKPLVLFAPTASAITAIKYRKKDGSTDTTVDPSTYRLMRRPPGGHPWVVPVAGECWPSDELESGLPVTIEYTAGFGNDGSAVPSPIKAAILLQTAALYENREQELRGNNTIPSQLANGVWDLISEYRYH